MGVTGAMGWLAVAVYGLLAIGYVWADQQNTTSRDAA
jgi:hypothetical protein